MLFRNKNLTMKNKIKLLIFLVLLLQITKAQNITEQLPKFDKQQAFKLSCKQIDSVTLDLTLGKPKI